VTLEYTLTGNTFSFQHRSDQNEVASPTR